MSKGEKGRAHKPCECLSCQGIGTKAAIATEAVEDLAAENARLRAELAALRVDIAMRQREDSPCEQPENTTP